VSEKKNLTGEQKVLSIPDLPKSNEKKQVGSQIVSQVVETVVRPKPGLETPQVSRPPIREISKTSTQLPGISIKDALNAAGKGLQKADQENDVDEPIESEVTEIVEKQVLTDELLGICWNSFAVLLREDKPRMAVTLKNVQPRIKDDYIITIELNNRSQLEDFNNNTRNELEKFLRHEMHNSDITIESSLIESEETGQTKLYTSEEKFKYLSQKNPVLAKFRQKLNLELE